MSDFVIREFQDSDSFSELTHLIHSAYKQLADMGLNYWGTWQSEDITKQRVETSHTTLVGVQDGKLIATISLYSSQPDHEREHYREAWYFGQFAVRPDLQKSGIGSQLLSLVEERAKSSRAKRISLSTAVPARHLIEYYEKRGYSFVEFIDHEPSDKVNYRSVIMSKQL